MISGLPAVARILAAVYLVLAGFALLATLLSLAAEGGRHALAFGGCAATAAFVGMALWLTAMGRRQASGAREALLAAGLAWTTAPALAAIPFLWGAAADGFVRAYFDAVSALTTTGFAPIYAGEEGSGALILWWGGLQWLGGFAAILSALMVLGALNLSGPSAPSSTLFTVDAERLIGRSAAVAPQAALIYAIVSLVVFLGALAWGARAGEALSLAFASVSTGGLVLPDGRAATAGLPLGALAFAMFGLLFGALSFGLHWEAARGRSLIAYLRDPEARAIAALALSAAALAALGSGRTDPYGLFAAGLEGASLAFTAVWPAEAQTPALAAVTVLALIFIGGSPVSTAGGVKMIRLLLLFRHGEDELRRLVHPSSVHESRFRGRPLGGRLVEALLLAVLCQVLLVGGLATSLALFGADMQGAVAAAAAAASNAGPALAMAGGERADAALASAPAQIAACIGMIAGRMEMLACVALLAPSFWAR